MRQDRDDETTIIEIQHAWSSSMSGAFTDLNQPTCHGCLNKPDYECAACGAPASMWTEAGDGRHAVAWCATCHDELVAGRPINAQALIYLTFAPTIPVAPTH
jgi:hypothetical protein